MDPRTVTCIDYQRVTSREGHAEGSVWAQCSVGGLSVTRVSVKAGVSGINQSYDSDEEFSGGRKTAWRPSSEFIK